MNIVRSKDDIFGDVQVSSVRQDLQRFGPTVEGFRRGEKSSADHPNLSCAFGQWRSQYRGRLPRPSSGTTVVPATAVPETT